MWRSSSLLLVRQTRRGCRAFRQGRGEHVPKIESSPNAPLQSKIGKPIAFTVGTTALVYTGAALMAYENARAANHRRTRNPVRALYEPEGSSIFHTVKKWWRTQTRGKKLFYGILAANGMVFVMWRIPRLSDFMYKYFTHSPTSNMVSPMLLSTFSHSSLVHLGCNMIVLHSFIDQAVALMGMEPFLATYLSGGVVASLFSHIGKIYTNTGVASLGASGALLTVISCVCMAFPEHPMQIVFLPMVTFKCITGLQGLMAFDTIGLLSRWRFFDHAAHLGGALFGIGYFWWGHKLFITYSKGVLDYWNGIRERASKKKDP